MTNPKPTKAWRIKKGEPIPQWLEKTENAELTAGCDLIVIEAEDAGFDVYRSDPNSFANMMEGTRPDPNKHTTVTGAPTNLHAPTALEAQISNLQAEIAELTRPSEQAVTEAMVEAACKALDPETWERWPERFKVRERPRIRAALKAAMEAGRHE